MISNEKIILLVILSLCTVSIAQGQDDNSIIKTIGNAIDSTKTMANQGIHSFDTSSNFKLIYSDFKSGMAGMASALKVTTEHVYVVLVKQQVVKSISTLMIIIFWFVMFFIFYRFSKSSYNKHLLTNQSYTIDETILGAMSILSALASVGCFIGGACLFGLNYNKIITGFINPEYGAITDVFEFIKTVTEK